MAALLNHSQSESESSHMKLDKLTSDIFSVLENNFLFGHHHRNGKVAILTIDSGDHALLAANTLLHLETILRRKSGNPTAHIADFFDVVAGSGAGGILAGLLFTRGKDGYPICTAQESLNFILHNAPKLANSSPAAGIFRRCSKPKKLLDKVFGDLTLKDTLKAVLIPCYDLTTGAPFLFSRADALEMDGCDFRMADVCRATLAGAGGRAVEVKSRTKKKLVAVGGGVGVSNPTAAAITHVLNNKQEFPVCKGVEDLLVLSLGRVGLSNYTHSPAAAFLKIAGDGAADTVDEAVSMAFGDQWRTSNYVRIQGNGIVVGNKKREKLLMMRMADEIVMREKNVESVLFKGKKIVEEYTNMEKLEMFGEEVMKEQERRRRRKSCRCCSCILPNVLLKHHPTAATTRSSSATTLSSTLSP
ncbi:hypothetical protein BUALT_Bualt16G0130400 [Buddleja alternifolia]|uniref:PNPLA domain-containing protein n=1 Tax=Buddleja alternifolia TaxID=168488 RepID=A0AAV6WBD6_9LAMI|nr:hypothetical protein BUALT_Bualt16G0130400 [Buddleja alternifolia]